MAGITHAFVSGKSDGSDTGLVRPSNWNASHVIGDGTMTIDAASSVATFVLTTGTLTALTLGTTDFLTTFAHIFDFGTNDDPNFVLQNSSAGVNGPNLTLRQNSASPATSDIVGSVNFYGKDSAANDQAYAQIWTEIIDATSTSEDSMLKFSSWSAGASILSLTIGNADAFDATGRLTHRFGFADSVAPRVEAYSTYTGATGPSVQIIHDTSSPANSDIPGNWRVFGRDSAANVQEWSSITTTINDVTSTSEDSSVGVTVQSAGSAVQVLTVGTGTTVGSNTPLAMFDLTSLDAPSLIIKNSSAAGNGPGIRIFQDSASPAASDAPGDIAFFGRDSAANIQVYGQISTAITDATSGSEDATLSILTPVAGTHSTRLRAGAGIYHPSATGTDKGDNSTNFSAQYDDGTLLTCYVNEAAKIGSVDLAYWDSKVENVNVPATKQKIVSEDGTISFKEIEPAYTIEKIHEPVRKFASRLGTVYDPTSLAGQRKHLEDKKHLTSYPNPDKWCEDRRPSMGKWIQSGVEMDECLFLYICQLDDRLKALESPKNASSRPKRNRVQDRSGRASRASA